MDAAERVPTELRGLWLRSLRRKDKEYRPGGDFPPVARGGSFGRGGKVVLVEAKAEVIIGVRRGAIGEETPDSGRSPL